MRVNEPRIVVCPSYFPKFVPTSSKLLRVPCWSLNPCLQGMSVGVGLPQPLLRWFPSCPEFLLALELDSYFENPYQFRAGSKFSGIGPRFSIHIRISTKF
jgi:hypothetical protein